MAWWAWLLLIISALLLPAALLLLLPLRIFVRYLRENRKDQISLRIKLGFVGLRLHLWRESTAGGSFARHLALGRLALPAALLEKAAGRMGWTRNILDPKKPAGLFALRREAAPLLKRIIWSRFDLELSWGWEDPALTGLAAGGCWALGGILAGLLQEYFSVKTRPQLSIRPLFRPAHLRLRWEGEAALPFYRWLELWYRMKKIGGAASGTSSH